MSEIEDKLKQLPYLPDIIFELQKIRNSDDLDIDKILNILEEDHFITAKILQLSNSKLFGFPNHIDTFNKAFSLYGVNFTVSFAIVQVIQNSLKWNFDLYELETKKFFDLSLFSCKLMFLWLEDEDILEKERLLIPCLLNDIGKSFICSLVKKEDEGLFFNKLKNNPLDISSIEKEFISFSSSQITAMILDIWNFDKNTIELIKNIDFPNNKDTKILNVIKTIFNVKEPFSKESILFGLKKAKEYELDEISLKKALQKLMILIKDDI